MIDYVARAKEIVIPIDMTPTAGLRITAEIDQLMGEIYDQYIKSKQEFKNLEDQAYRSIRVQKAVIKQNSANIKLSNDLIETMAYKAIEDSGLFAKLDTARTEFIYWDEIMHFLKSKKDSLVSTSAFMKLDASLNSSRI